MTGRFLRRNPVTRAMRAELADDLAHLGRPDVANERACCCPARPMVTVMMPPIPGRPYPIDLLLCGHHYRVSQAALRAAGVTVYDQAGAPITGGVSDHQDSRQPAGGSAASVTDKSCVPNRLGDTVGAPPGITACDLRPCPPPSARGQHLWS